MFHLMQSQETRWSFPTRQEKVWTEKAGPRDGAVTCTDGLVTNKPGTLKSQCTSLFALQFSKKLRDLERRPHIYCTVALFVPRCCSLTLISNIGTPGWGSMHISNHSCQSASSSLICLVHSHAKCAGGVPWVKYTANNGFGLLKESHSHIMLGKFVHPKGTWGYGAMGWFAVYI